MGKLKTETLRGNRKQKKEPLKAVNEIGQKLKKKNSKKK